MHCARVCKQTSPIRGQASAVTTCNCQWPGRAHGGLSPPVLRHRLSLGSIKVSSIKKNSSARNEIDNVPEGKYVADKKHQDQTLSSERLVADTSDEDSNLPDSPLDMDEELIIPQKPTASNYYLRLPTAHKTDIMSNEPGEGPNARRLTLDAESRDSDSSSVASIDSDDIELADELAHSFRFEGAGLAARSLKTRHDIDVEKHRPAGSSMEHQLPSRGEGNRIRNPINSSNQGKVQYACFNTGHQGKPLQAGSFRKDTHDREGSTHKESMYNSFDRNLNDVETFEERLEGQPRYQGWVQAIDEIQTKTPKQDRQPNLGMYSLREEAEIGGLDFAFKGQQNDDELQDQKEVDDEANRDRDHSTASNIVSQLAAKAAKTATELSPLNQLANMRQVHRENRDLRDEVHYQTNTSSPSFKTRVARIIEVASGRAALVGLVAAPFSEIVYRQSILSQLLGRWEGVRHVEYAIPSARMLAEAVVIASLTFTVVEALVGQGLPPSSKWPFTRLSPFLQLWVGRVAAIGFAALLLFEVQQSNRPAFFWFLHP